MSTAIETKPKKIVKSFLPALARKIIRGFKILIVPSPLRWFGLLAIRKLAVPAWCRGASCTPFPLPCEGAGPSVRCSAARPDERHVSGCSFFFRTE